MRLVLTSLLSCFPWTFIAHAEDDASAHRPEWIQSHAESYCHGSLPAVRIYIGEGPLCGGWKLSRGFKNIQYDRESMTISAETFSIEPQQPHHSECAAWGPIYVGGVLPHPGYSFQTGILAESNAWTLKLNNKNAGSIKLWMEYDGASQQSLPHCQKI
jgi:hypothetical protein